MRCIRPRWKNPRADFDLMCGGDELPWDAVLGVRSAVWRAQTSDEQRRNASQGSSSLRVETKCGPRVVALLANRTTIRCVATPSGHPHLVSTHPYIKSKSALRFSNFMPTHIGHQSANMAYAILIE